MPKKKGRKKNLKVKIKKGVKTAPMPSIVPKKTRDKIAVKKIKRKRKEII